MKDIYILAIESSCDETSMSIIKNGREEIATVVLSQIDIHKNYGGVVPEIASRNHIENITIVLDEILNKSNMTLDEIDAIGVTYGPGLIGSLLIGVQAAKTIALVTGKPLIPVHHIAGHIYANNLEKRLQFPLIALVVSGGHSELIYMKEDYSFERIGGTLDDAVGECYDKVGKVIGVPYPGGPKVDKLAHEGKDTYDLPYPLDDKSYNFSFSGIKSAVINLVHNEKQRGNEINKEDLCTTFQNRVVTILTKKTMRALKEYNVKNLILAGGVSANKGLRNSLEEACKKENIDFEDNSAFHSFVISDGDNMQWTMGEFLDSPVYYGNKDRNRSPVSWTLCPINLSVVSTSTWNRFVTMKKDNSSVIEYGGGYQYPDEFAKNRPNREELLIEFAQRMNWHFKKLNIKIFGFICFKRGNTLKTTYGVQKVI